MTDQRKKKKTCERLMELEEAIKSQRRLVALDLAARARLTELLMELDSLLRSCGTMSRAA
jgi:hypothetical protein